MISTKKTSISLSLPLWEHLQKFSNKSAVISEALSLYFDKTKALENAENLYWEKVEKSLQGENYEYQSFNPNGEKLSENILEDTLWK